VEASSQSSQCKRVGWIAGLKPRGSGATLRLAATYATCSCPPSTKCALVRKDQILFPDEQLFSGAGQLTFKSAVKYAPALTCIMSNKTRGVIFPSGMTFASPTAHAFLELIRGAVSCQVAQGAWHNASADAVFVVDNTQITVRTEVDPVFGAKTTIKGSLI